MPTVIIENLIATVDNEEEFSEELEEFLYEQVGKQWQYNLEVED